MKKLLLAVLFLAGCATNPYTGRKQLLLLSEAQEAAMGIQAYQEALAQATLSTNPAETAPVRRVGERIAAVANKPDFQWEFNVLVDDGMVNAWCLPGGKIAFYTGIYPVLQDEAGMAFVMGHEVAHALLRHGAERVSENMVAGGVGALLGATLGSRSPESQAVVMAAYGVATNLGVLLPHSREQESEADRLGLELMAQAGYDPRQAVEVWKRMEQKAGGGGPPEFLSTHPSHQTRIQDLESRMAGALALYEAAASKAAVAKLPAVGGRKGGTAAAAHALAPDAIRPASLAARRGTLEDGRKAVALPFSFPEAVYLEEVRVSGPGGLSQKVVSRQGVPGNAARQVVLTLPASAPGEIPAGRYTLEFKGARSGRPFTSTTSYDLP